MVEVLGLVLVGVGLAWMFGLCVVLVRADRQQREHLALPVAVPVLASRRPRHCRRSVWAMVWAMTWAGTA